jgi:hypothetical protein
MSRNIPTNDQTYKQFTSIKKATGKLINNERITNDIFIDMLIADFSMKDKALDYIARDTENIKKANNGGH